jgi:BirA family biotin operon repressor/biotin-[acetyl-CoA-carboxylase] ligase
VAAGATPLSAPVRARIETPVPALPRRLFAALADGALHSGAELAAREGVTRSAVWKAIGQLRDDGALIDAVPNRGYRMQFACALLDGDAMRAALPTAQRARFDAVESVWSVDSTNTALLARGAPPPGEFRLLVAEHQGAGRGRLGRRWVGALGGSVLMSVSAGLAELPRDVATLPLVAGLAVRRALERLGVAGVLLKWPNDIVARIGAKRAGEPPTGLVLHKLGGILTELRAEASGPAHVVIGIGLNLRLGEPQHRDIAAGALPPAALADLGNVLPDRNVLAAAITAECVAGLDALRRDGFAARRAEWNAADALADQPVTVRGAGDEAISGIARGIDATGALQLEHAGVLRSVLAGDVSLRPQP